MVKIEGMMQFPVADWAESERTCVCVLEAITAVHGALIVDTVQEAKGVTELVSSDFASSN